MYMIKILNFYQILNFTLSFLFNKKFNEVELIKKNIEESSNIFDIGSNLGNRVQNIQKSKFELERFKIKILKSSSHYISESWPNPLMPMYVNIVLKVKCFFGYQKV